MFNPDIFGFLATGLNVIMLLPQVIQAYKTKRTGDLSFLTLTLFLIACIFWIFYGLAKHALPVVISNTVVGTMNLILIIIKLRSPKKIV